MALAMIVDHRLAGVSGVLGQVCQGHVKVTLCLPEEPRPELVTVPGSHVTGHVVPQSVTRHGGGPAFVEEHKALLLVPGELPHLHVRVQVAPVILSKPLEYLDVLRVKVHHVVVLGQEELDGVRPASPSYCIDNVAQRLLVVRLQQDVSLLVHNNQFVRRRQEALS